MQCKYDIDFILSYNSNALSEETKKPFEEHLNSCNSCRYMMKMDELTIETIKKEIEKEPIPLNEIMSKIDLNLYKGSEKLWL